MRRKMPLFCVLCLGLLLGGCGYTPLPTTGSPPPTTTVIASATLTTPSASASPVATVPSGSTSAPHSGLVTVQTSAAFYHPSDTLVVTVSDHMAQPIFFADHQTNCSVVLLQLQTGSSWQSMALCKLMIMTRIETLDAGKNLTISLKAGFPLWPAGIYRIAFHYSGQTTGTIGAFQETFSPLFRIR